MIRGRVPRANPLAPRSRMVQLLIVPARSLAEDATALAGPKSARAVARAGTGRPLRRGLTRCGPQAGCRTELRILRPLAPASRRLRRLCPGRFGAGGQSGMIAGGTEPDGRPRAAGRV